MTTPAPQSTEPRAFVDARFIQQRVISESITSLLAGPRRCRSKWKSAPKSKQLLGRIRQPGEANEMFIELEFRVDLKLPEKEKDLVSYLAKHAAHFKVVGWTGFNE